MLPTSRQAKAARSGWDSSALRATPQQAIHQETVLGLVAAGLGISVLPESVQRFQMPGVTTRGFVGRPQTELRLARPFGRSPAMDDFILCLKGGIPE
jgi:DNA-binding transcriptional LysR family regulator